MFRETEYKRLEGKIVMSETINYGYGWAVEHIDLDSYVFHNGQVVKKFYGEQAWSDAERYAYDNYFKEMISA